MIKRLKELREKATPGKWDFSGTGAIFTEHYIEADIGNIDKKNFYNAALIVETINNLDKLLAIAEISENLVCSRYNTELAIWKSKLADALSDLEHQYEDR